MKKLKHFTSGLLLSLFAATSVFAETPAQTTTPVAQSVTAQPQAVQNSTQTANPNQVNINTATAAEIQDKLVGIGAKKAQAIVEYREKNGGFRSIEQLKEVSGIGNATLEKNRERIVL